MHFRKGTNTEIYQAVSGKSATIKTVLHQSWVIYPNQIYALSLEMGHFKSKKDRIILKT